MRWTVVTCMTLAGIGSCLAALIDYFSVRPEEFNYVLIELDVTSGLPELYRLGREKYFKLQPRVNCTIAIKFGDSAKHVDYRMEKFERSVRENFI